MQVINKYQAQEYNDHTQMDINSDHTSSKLGDGQYNQENLTSKLTRAFKSIGKGLESQAVDEFRRQTY